MAKRGSGSSATVPTSGRKIRLWFGPDHTASMGQWRYIVRQNGCEAVRKWFAQASGGRLEVGVFPILDLHDQGGRDFLTFMPNGDVNQVVKFIRSIPDAVSNSSGEECWERLFHRWGEMLLDGDLETGPNDVNVGIIVGDSQPHPIGHRKNRERFDWREKLQRIMSAKHLNFTLHTVYAPHWSGEDPFWAEAARMGKGINVEMDEFSHLVDLVRGVIARETHSFADFIAQREKEGPMSYAFQRAMDKLSAGTGAKFKRGFTAATNGDVARSGRFQPYTIDEDVSTSNFFVDLGVIDDPADYDRKCLGSLFYVPVRAELIRPNHEVIVLDETTGLKYIGRAARDKIGIPYGTKGAKLTLKELKGRGLKIAIQTKSREASNPRVLHRGQEVFVDTMPNDGFSR